MNFLSLSGFTGLLLAASILPAAAQQRLTGKVLDAATGQPVPYASVSVLDSRLGTTSNAEGDFELSAPLPGRLVISELGHQRDTVAVAAATQPLQIRLQPASVLLPEVQVGSYLGDLIAQAYRQMRKTNTQKMYGRAFYRQITRIANDATEVQEMVWATETSSAGLGGTALTQGRFAKKKALLHFNNFSIYTKATHFNTKDDSTTLKTIIGPNAARFYTLSLLGVTQNGDQQLVEIGFASKPGLTPTLDQGRLTIDERTHQILHFRLETPALISLKINNPLYKFQDMATVLDMDFQPSAQGAVLNYVRIDFRATVARALMRNVGIQASSLAYFYDGHTTPAASVTYIPAKGGEMDLAAIKQTTYDPAFWQNNSVVKRTPLEDRVMKSFEQKGAFGTMLTP